jgi:alkylhydroperoxidase family enzyme
MGRTRVVHHAGSRTDGAPTWLNPAVDAAGDKHAHLREQLEHAVRSGDGAVSPAERQTAFDAPEQLGGARGRYCAQVALDANGVTDADVAALHAEGLDDGRIFEYTVAAAVGQASRQLSAALAALERSGERGGA